MFDSIYTEVEWFCPSFIILLMQIFNRSSMRTGFKTVELEGFKIEQAKKKQLPEGIFVVGP